LEGWEVGAHCRGVDKITQQMRARLTTAQQDRVDALPYGSPDPDVALDALKADVKRQREQDPAWRMPALHEMATTWDAAWHAGILVHFRRGEGKQAQQARACLTAAQREHVDALPYGAVAVDPNAALDALEGEVALQQQQDPGWRMPKSHVMVTA